jgi:hypothetical protein
MLLLFLIQAAAVPPPDLQLDLRATARVVRIERSGETSLTVRATPDAGSSSSTEKPEAEGRRRLRNVDVHVRAEARIGDPRNPGETPEPQ